MARKVADEVIKLSIEVNGNEAQRELIGLEKDTRKLKQANQDLSKSKRELVAQGKKNSQEYRNLSEEINKNNLEMTKNKNRMSELQKEIGLTGLTISQLKARAIQLRATLTNMVPGSQDYNRYQAELKETEARLKELSGRAVSTKLTLGSIADSFNRYASLGATAIAAFTGFYFSLQKIVDMSGKLSKAIAGVQKNTNMTKQEVEELAKSFSKLDTPTSKIDLLAIAEVGGKLNIAKDEIFDFVKVMDVANVALGDAFEGGAEEVATKLGKIKGLFQETKNIGTEAAFNSIGSALNDLGKEGAATEQNISEFVTRIGAMPEALRPSIQEALGLGAAFEESGLKAEVAANNYSKVIAIAARDYKEFAKQMKLPAEEVKKLINSNPTEFFLKFSESLKGLSATQIASVLDNLKLNDQEVKQVIGAASANVDKFREKIILANQSYLDATSLTKEYAVMNETLAAVLSKVGKTLAGIFTSDFVVNGLTSFVTWFAKLIGATEDAEGSTKTFRNTLVFTVKMITVLTAALASAVVWKKLVALWTTRNTAGNLLYTASLKAKIVAENLGIVATQAYAIVTMLLTGNLRGAAQAFRVLTATMMTTPWGFIIGAVAAIGTAYLMFRDNAEKASLLQKTMNDVHQEASRNIAKEKNEVDLLVKAINSEHISKERKIELLNQLKAIAPEYLNNLTLENIKTAEGKKILDAYTDSLYKNARAKAVRSKFDELAEKRLETENKTSQDYSSSVTDFIFGREDNFKDKKDIEKYVRERFKGKNEKFIIETINSMYKYYNLDEKANDLKSIDAQMKELEKELIGNSITGKNGQKNTDFTPTTVNDPTNQSAIKTQQEKDYTDDLKRLKSEQLNIEREAIDAKLSLMIDGIEKEKAIELERNRRALEDLNNRLVSQGDIALAISKSNDSKRSKQERDFWKNQAQSWQDNNKHVYSLIESEKSSHLNKMNAIAVKSHTEYLQQLDQNHKDEIASVELAYAEKRITKEQREQQLLDIQVKYLENTIKQLNDTIANNSIDGIDLSMVLNDKEIENMMQLVKKLQTELAALKNPEAKKDDLGDNPFSFANGNTDILGFTADQWTQVFDNLDTIQGKMALTNMAIGAMQQMWQSYSQIQNNNAQNEVKVHERATSSRIKMLKRQLDLGLITQDQYNAKVEKLEADLDAKKAEIEYNQAKRQREMALANIAISTAQGIMQLWVNPGFPAAIPLAVALGAAGIMQAAVVMSQPLPARGYEDGYYDVLREQDKKPFKAKYGGSMTNGLFSKPTFLVGEGPENSPELVVDKKAFAQISPTVKNALLYELGIMKGFENGYYKNVTQTPPTYTNNATSTDNTELLTMVLQLMQKNINVLEKIEQNGVIGKFYDKDLESMRAINKGLKNYSEITNKAKR